MFVMNTLSWKACPTTAVIPSATMIEMIAIRIGISAPVSVPNTNSNTISAAGSPKRSSPLLRSLLEIVVKS